MEKEINILEYWKIFKKNFKIFLLIFLVFFIAIIIYTLSLPKVYIAKSSIIFSLNSQASTIGGLSINLGGGGGEGSMPVSTLFGGLSPRVTNAMYNKLILESRILKEQVIDKLNLREIFHTKSLEKLAEILKKNTKIEIDKDGILLTIKVSANKPELSSKIANAYLDTLKEYNQKNNRSTSHKHRIFVEKQLKVKKEELKNLENEMKIYEEKNKIFSLDNYTNGILSRFTILKDKEIDAKIFIKQLEADLNSRRQSLILQNNRFFKNSFEEIISKDAAINLWREKLIEKEYNLVLNLQNKKEDHPLVLYFKEEIKQIKSKLKDQVLRLNKAVLSGSDLDIYVLYAQKISYEARLAAINNLKVKLEKEMRHLPDKIYKYMRIKRELQIKEVLTTMLEQDLEHAKISEARETPELEILDRAVAPERKSAPNTKLNIILGAFIGVLLGIIAVFIWEYLNDVVFKEVENV